VDEGLYEKSLRETKKARQAFIKRRQTFEKRMLKKEEEKKKTKEKPETHG